MTDENEIQIAELTAEIAALRCAMHALTHTLITPEASDSDAVKFFDSLAAQWHRIDQETGSAPEGARGFQDQAAAIRRQIVVAVERRGRALH